MPDALLITRPEAVAAMAARLRQAPVIGVDTEFIRETTFFPKIALIQVATADESWLIDPVALGPDALEPFLEVLYDPQVLKVMHAAFADQEVLYWTYGQVAEPVLDTAVAAALCGYGDSVGLAKLARDVLRVQLHKGRARAKWLARPLPEELLAYAQQDVDHLVELSTRLKGELDKKHWWAWALEESRVDPRDFDTPPEDIAQRLARSGHLDEVSYLVLEELVRWREDRARSANLPRAWVADNEVLVALARARPRSVRELKSFRGLSPKEVERSGEALVGIIEHGMSRPKSEACLPERGQGEKIQNLALDVMKAYLSYLSDRHGVAPRLLVRTGKAAELISVSALGPDEWVRRGILSESAVRVVGHELKDWLDGKLLLGLRNGRVDVVSR